MKKLLKTKYKTFFPTYSVISYFKIITFTLQIMNYYYTLESCVKQDSGPSSGTDILSG